MPAFHCPWCASEFNYQVLWCTAHGSYFSISGNPFLLVPFSLLFLAENTIIYLISSSNQCFHLELSHRTSGRCPQSLYAALPTADGFSKYSGKVTTTDETALYGPSGPSHGLCGTSLSRNFCIGDGILRKSHPPSQGQRTSFEGICLVGFWCNNKW